MNIAFIGLGIMGSRMAHNLLAQGHQLSIYNRTASKAQALVQGGATLAASPQAAAQQAEVIITMLASPEVVQAVATGPQGFLAQAGQDKLWVDCSTVNPSFSRQMAQAATQAGYQFLDAPVVGTKAPAQNGQLLFLVGGPQVAVQQAQPLFEAMGRKTLHMGGHGQGSAMKMLVNMLLAQSMLAFTEALHLGQAMQFEQSTLLDVLLATPVTPDFLQAVRPKIEGQDWQPNFPIELMKKDLHLVAQTAYEHQVPMPTTNVAKEVYTMAANQPQRQGRDFTSIYQFMAQMGQAGQ